MALFPKIETTMHGHIEVTMYKHELHRVYRPFREHEYFLIPIVSVENEMLLDRERLEHVMIHGKPEFPAPITYLDGDEMRDYMNDSSFSGRNQYSEQEINS
jgi:hypothetical protein